MGRRLDRVTYRKELCFFWRGPFILEEFAKKEVLVFKLVELTVKPRPVIDLLLWFFIPGTILDFLRLSFDRLSMMEALFWMLSFSRMLILDTELHLETTDDISNRFFL